MGRHQLWSLTIDHALSSFELRHSTHHASRFRQSAKSCFNDHVALVFTGLQVRAANRARREQMAVTVIETAALSENSARFLELLSEIPEGASATVIENLDAETRRQIFLFGLRVEIIGYMVFHGLVDVQTVNDLAGGAILSFWSRAKN